jgi:hypothetical protein
MGNSPRKLFTNYRELVTPEAAQGWFTIPRMGADNILLFDLAAGKDGKSEEDREGRKSNRQPKKAKAVRKAG